MFGFIVFLLVCLPVTDDGDWQFCIFYTQSKRYPIVEQFNNVEVTNWAETISGLVFRRGTFGRPSE